MNNIFVFTRPIICTNWYCHRNLQCDIDIARLKLQVDATKLNGAFMFELKTFRVEAVG